MLDDFRDRGIKFRSLTESIDTETPTGRAMWQMIGVLAELERSLISERTRAGAAAAKARGVKFGRKPKLTAQKINQAAKLIAAGERAEDVAASFSVGRTTLYRALVDFHGTDFRGQVVGKLEYATSRNHGRGELEPAGEQKSVIRQEEVVRLKRWKKRESK